MAGAAAVPDILGVCGVDGGLVVSELVSVCGSAARDSRLAGFPVMGLWATSKISCRRVQIGVSLSVCSQFAIKFPLAMGSSCSGYQSFGISKINYVEGFYSLKSASSVGAGDIVVIANQTKMIFQLVGGSVSLGVSVMSM
jgi:hypothetical protein